MEGLRFPRQARSLKLIGMLLLALAAGHLIPAWWGGEGGDGDVFPVSFFPRVMAQASADLGPGEYEFFPSRRSVWVINKASGRMAAYTFLNNEYSTVQRSRVAQIDLSTFPMGETRAMISDRNLNSILWIGNSRTGDVQMWTLGRDGEVRKAGPVATSADLMARE